MESLQPRNISKKRKLQLAAELLNELFLDYYKKLSKWAKLTGQSSQLDSGYIAQHLVSILTGIKGTGMRGKGKDLMDGSEVKTASSIAGVDVPRWNHNLTTQETKNTFLSAPHIFYVLFDTPSKASKRVRVRIWAVTPAVDDAFRSVIDRWWNLSSRSNNFQLHPPVCKKVDIGTNECGNLELPLMFKAEENKDGKFSVKVLESDFSRKSRLIERTGQHTRADSHQTTF